MNHFFYSFIYICQMTTEYQLYKQIGFITGPLLFLFFLLAPFEIHSPIAQKVIAVAAWMVIWWITEAVSISVTALIPLTLFPILGVMEIKTVTASYGSPIVFLFFGGFVLALALEKVNLHKRIALNIIKLTGTSADHIILGFMIATASLSMWISNTASTVVMLPIAISVIKLLMNDEDGFTEGDQNFALSIMLGIAFAANIGGVATLIGTPPNSVLVGFMEEEHDVVISFFTWMQMGIPFSLIMLSITYWVIVKWVYPNGLDDFKNSSNVIQTELDKLGSVSKNEKIVLAVFAMAILLWVFRTLINSYFPELKLSDAGISMMAALTLFSLPYSLKNGGFVLDWKDTINLPWGILILFGGGLALAKGMSTAGIIDFIGQLIASYRGLSIIAISALLILVMLFMTELMSNVALVSIFVPVVAGIALGLEASILHLTIPIAMASSCAFMLPMATPPNAIVFASGHIKVYQMAKVGIILNVVAVLLIVLFTKFLIPVLF